VPGPLDCFLVHRGLRTLALRMAAHAANGMAVSAFLSEQPCVDDVR
jgi:cystathionine gamma-synthase